MNALEFIVALAGSNLAIEILKHVFKKKEDDVSVTREYYQHLDERNEKLEALRDATIEKYRALEVENIKQEFKLARQEELIKGRDKMLEVERRANRNIVAENDKLRRRIAELEGK